MVRIPLAGLASIALVGLSHAQLPIDPEVRPQAWPMRYANAARTGQSGLPGASAGVVDWEFPIAGRAYSFAVDRRGNIHAGVVFHDRFWSSKTYAYVLTDAGDVAWRAEVTPYVWGFGQNVFSSPALDPFGQVVVPSSSSELIKFRADGTVDWTVAGNTNAGNDSSPVVRPDGSIVHYQSTVLTSLSPSGQTQWTRAGLSGSFSSPALAPSGDLAIGGVHSNEPHGFPALYYINANGTIRWQRTTLFGSANVPIFGPDGTLYHCTEGLTAYEPDGTIRWSMTFGDQTPALSAQGLLVVADGAVLRGVDPATGSQTFSLTAPGTIQDGIAIGRDGTLYVTTSSGHLCAYTQQGATLFETKVCDAFTSGPVVGGTRNCIAAARFGNFDYRIVSVR